MRNSRFALSATLLLSVAAAILTAGLGCRESAPMLDDQNSATEVSEYSEELFAVAMDNLGRLEQFRSGEMLQEIVERLNQWASVQTPPAGWRPDPLLETLPEPLRELPMLAELDALQFPRYDGSVLQQAVWMRNVARWARGEKLDDLTRAMRLFDWTVRNIQLDSFEEPSAEAGATLGRLPWETLLLGHGDVLERAWVYIELLRQEGIDAAMLALPRKEAAASSDALRAWAIGVLIEDEVFLFDPVLGLPIPGPDGVYLDSDGRLAIRPATLDEAASDPEVLKRLALDESTPYPIGSDDLDGAVVLIAAGPSELSQRMALVESHLAGEQKLVLTVDASGQGERFAATPRIAGARLWTKPYITLAQQLLLGDNPQAVQHRFAEMAPFHVGPDAPLWKARILHFKGEFVGENGATQYYQLARPPNSQLAAFADMFYRSLKTAQPEANDAELRQMAEQRAAMEKPVFVRAKQNASYWLGLLAYEQEVYPAAIDYLATRTLEASPDGPWTHGARYNLARTFEAAGELDRAVSQLASDPLSPSRHGNLLRARWLAELLAEQEAEELPLESDPEPAQPEQAPMEPQQPERQTKETPEPAPPHPSEASED